MYPVECIFMITMYITLSSNENIRLIRADLPYINYLLAIIIFGSVFNLSGEIYVFFFTLFGTLAIIFLHAILRNRERGHAAIFPQ